MRNVVLGFCSAVLIGIAGYVIAQTTSEVDRDTQLRLARMDTSPAAFRKLDQNNDGRISPLEAAENPKVAAAFTMADRNKDGYLSREEFEALGSSSSESPSPHP